MITISYKNKNKLLEKLLEQENITTLEKRSLVSKLTLKQKEYADIYFHSGEIDKESSLNIKNAKKIICNSYALKHKILEKTNVEDDKVEVIYPSVEKPILKAKEVKKEFCERNEIDKKTKLIFFTAKNLKKSGVKEFVDIIIQLNYKNFKAIISGDKNQLDNLKFQISKYNLDDKLLLLEDYENMEELYLACDIFILPTYTQNFASSILKAMASSSAVFVSASNASREVVDVFATMENPEDPSTPFKVDALLGRKEDLKLIKKQNKKAIKDFALEKAILKINKIVDVI